MQMSHVSMILTVRHCSNVQEVGDILHSRRNQQKEPHSASEKWSPLGNHNTVLPWTSKKYGSLSFFLGVLTTHPKENTLLCGKIVARQVLQSLCACLVCR